jgi:tetratricopeptide (TPR) repeat protein
VCLVLYPLPCPSTTYPLLTTGTGRFAEAEGYAHRAVESLRTGVGPDDVSTATALYNLAGLAKRQGKFESAAGSYASALRIFRERLGEGVGETADTLYQIAGLSKRQGNLPAAARYFAQAAEAYAAAYGREDKRAVEAGKRAKAAAEKLTTTAHAAA